MKKMMAITLLIAVSAAASTTTRNCTAEYSGAYVAALERVQEAYEAIFVAANHGSRCTVSGENAGRHTAMYSAPSGDGVLY